MLQARMRILPFLVLSVLVTLAVSPVTAQDAAPSCSTSETPTGCAVVSISPSGLTGDFYLGETLAATGQSIAAISVPPGSSRIDVRNIQSTEQGYGTLFIYKDTYVTVYTTEGQARQATAYTQKQYIRGTLAFTCDIRNTVEGDSVGCQVSIDSVVQPDIIPPAGKSSYILDPGSHALAVTLVGDHAALWDPASRSQNVSINASATPRQVSMRFDKKVLVTLALDQPNVTADFYVDGQLVATQVATFQLYVTPNKSHRFEAKNITDPAANGVYQWKDASTYGYYSPGAVKNVTFRLQKQWLKGFLELTCQVNNPPPSEQLFCQPVIDGASVEQILMCGKLQYTLDPGSHQVVVTLVPQGNWIAQPVTLRPYITAGYTTRQTASFRPRTPPTPTPTAPPPPPSAGTVDIVFILYDGAVRQTESDEYVVIRNTGNAAVDLSGWHLNAGDPGQDYWFPNFVLQPGQECRVYTNEIHPEHCGFSFGRGSAIWNNDGDCGYLYDPSGNQVDSYCY